MIVSTSRHFTAGRPAVEIHAEKATVEAVVSTSCPASILRLHPEATLYIDAAAAARLGA